MPRRERMQMEPELGIQAVVASVDPPTASLSRPAQTCRCGVMSRRYSSPKLVDFAELFALTMV